MDSTLFTGPGAWPLSFSLPPPSFPSGQELSFPFGRIAGPDRVFLDKTTRCPKNLMTFRAVICALRTVSLLFSFPFLPPSLVRSLPPPSLNSVVSPDSRMEQMEEVAGTIAVRARTTMLAPCFSFSLLLLFFPPPPLSELFISSVPRGVFLALATTRRNESVGDSKAVGSR